VAWFERESTSIWFEERGGGFPLLLLAPGGMNSTIEMWERAALNPLVALAGDYRMIAMDQRNTGRSSGPIEKDDPWGSYASDQLALLDHLGLHQFAVMGCCIGGSFILKLIEQAPDRVVAAVLEQPIGVGPQNAHLFGELWQTWAKKLVETRPDIDAADAEAFGAAMWAGDFVVSVPEQVVRSCPTPLLVLPGTDEYHPTETGRRIAAIAPQASAVEPWKDTPEHLRRAAEAVRTFLAAHTP
jgi:pimeloyl-ACP methyl ester carboxylesterase